ncbi:MAG: hypothetical protein U0R27_11795 [Candidatus Nanopelagicales bacterium]|jgi:uncharacterized protein YdhG (YjbR/CyaY superfamily)|nr:hypothetical protein [Actinomycetota bacterium]MCB0920516.1 hypothetical protein [Actinomycetota bacterium]HNE87911.1 hypothetical protein [Actinomycetota bacterium]HNL50728.1 hypothetical protein [Actinomycetota bacterium]HNO14863.1 hypothetical protein [Actinomycetota bacterium]
MAKSDEGFSAAEREAMKQRAAELASMKGVKGAAKKAKEYEACLEAIDALTGLDRTIAERFHVVVSEEAPHLDPKTWYGFPSYARDGKVVTFVQPASKFDSRYASVGFNEDASLDDGDMWATTFAVVEWTDDVESRLRALVRKAAG